MNCQTRAFWDQEQDGVSAPTTLVSIVLQAREESIWVGQEAVSDLCP